MPFHGTVVVIKKNGDDGSKFQVTENICTFGRGINCDVRIQSLTSSGEHCKLEVLEDNTVKLINLKSTRTLVNKKTLIDEITLKDHDIFTIGERSFRFEYPSPLQHLKTPSNLMDENSVRTKLIIENTPISSTKKMLNKNRKSVTRNIKTPISSVFLKDLSSNSTQKKRKLVTKNTSNKKKRVTFGPSLSPEQFNIDFPPITPLKRGGIPFKRRSTPGRMIQDKTNKDNKLRRHSEMFKGKSLKENSTPLQENAQVVLAIQSDSVNSSTNLVSESSQEYTAEQNAINESLFNIPEATDNSFDVNNDINKTKSDAEQNLKTFVKQRISKRRSQSSISEDGINLSYIYKTDDQADNCETSFISQRKSSPESYIKVGDMSSNSISEQGLENSMKTNTTFNLTNTNRSQILDYSYLNELDGNETNNDETSIRSQSRLSRNSVNKLEINRCDKLSRSLPEKKRKPSSLNATSQTRRFSLRNQSRNSSTDLKIRTEENDKKVLILEKNLQDAESSCDSSFLSKPNRRLLKYSDLQSGMLNEDIDSKTYSPMSPKKALISDVTVNLENAEALVMENSLNKNSCNNLKRKLSLRASTPSKKTSPVPKNLESSFNSLKTDFPNNLEKVNLNTSAESYCKKSSDKNQDYSASFVASPVDDSFNKSSISDFETEHVSNSLNVTFSPKVLNFSSNSPSSCNSSRTSFSLNLSCSSSENLETKDHTMSESLRLSETDSDLTRPLNSSLSPQTVSTRSRSSAGLTDYLGLSESDQECNFSMKSDLSPTKPRTRSSLISKTDSILAEALPKDQSICSSSACLVTLQEETTRLLRSGVKKADLRKSENSNLISCEHENEQYHEHASKDLMRSSNKILNETSFSVENTKELGNLELYPVSESNILKGDVLQTDNCNRSLTNIASSENASDLTVSLDLSHSKENISEVKQNTVKRRRFKVVSTKVIKKYPKKQTLAKMKRHLKKPGMLRFQSSPVKGEMTRLLRSGIKKADIRKSENSSLILCKHENVSKHSRQSVNKILNETSCSVEITKELDNVDLSIVLDSNISKGNILQTDDSQTSLSLSTNKTPKIPEDMFVSPLIANSRSRSRSRTMKWLQTENSMSSPLVNDMFKLGLECVDNNETLELSTNEIQGNSPNRLPGSRRSSRNFKSLVTVSGSVTPVLAHKSSSSTPKVKSAQKAKNIQSSKKTVTDTKIIQDIVTKELIEANTPPKIIIDTDETDKSVNVSCISTEIEQVIMHNATNRTPLPDYTKVEGVRRVLRRGTPAANYSGVQGVKMLFQGETPQADYTNVLGLKRVLQNHTLTPDYRRVSGMKRILNQQTPKADYTNVTGIKNLFKKSNTPDFRDVRGVKEVLRKRTPLPDYRRVSGIKRIFSKSKTPDYNKIEGMKYVLRNKTPLADYTNVSGIKEMFKTPIPVYKFEIPVKSKGSPKHSPAKTLYSPEKNKVSEQKSTVGLLNLESGNEDNKTNVENLQELTCDPVIKNKDMEKIEKEALLDLSKEINEANDNQGENKKKLPIRTTRKRKQDNGTVIAVGDKNRVHETTDVMSDPSVSRRTRNKNNDAKLQCLVDPPAKITEQHHTTKALSKRTSQRRKTSEGEVPNEIQQNQEVMDKPTKSLASKNDKKVKIVQENDENAANKANKDNEEPTKRLRSSRGKQDNKAISSSENDKENKSLENLQERIKLNEAEEKDVTMKSSTRSRRKITEHQTSASPELPPKRKTRNEKKKTSEELSGSDLVKEVVITKVRSKKITEMEPVKKPKAISSERSLRTRKDEAHKQIVTVKETRSSRSRTQSKEDVPIEKKRTNAKQTKQKGDLKKNVKEQEEEKMEQEENSRKYCPVLSPILEIQTPLVSSTSSRKTTRRTVKEANFSQPSFETKVNEQPQKRTLRSRTKKT